MGVLSTGHLCVVMFFLANVYLMVVFQHRSSPYDLGHVSTDVSSRRNHHDSEVGGARRMVPAVLSFRNRQGFQSGTQQTFSGGHTCSKNSSDNGTLYLSYSLHPADLCSGKFSKREPDADSDRSSDINDANFASFNRVVRILVQVHSRCSSRQRRSVIRDTWGRVARNPDSSVALVFLLARSPLTSSQPTANGVTATAYDSDSGDCDMGVLQREFSLYGDTILGDFGDTYHSVTYKSLMGMSWASKFCTQVTHLLKVDDDVYFNITNLLQALQSTSNSNLDLEAGYISGALNTKSTVARRGLWGLSHGQYSQSTWPPYCAGCAYIMTLTATRHLVSASEHTCYLPLEDVYITGLLARAVGLRCKADSKFPQWYTGWSPSNVAMVMTGKLYGLHGVTEEQTADLYRRIKTQQCTNCTDMNRLFLSFT